MSYLIQSDFKKQIQSDNLQQIIGGDFSILSNIELVAIEEASSYLIQKYDLTNAFQSMFAFDTTLVYQANNRVYLDAPVYDTTTNYSVGNAVIYANNYYICTATTTGTFVPGSWALINPQYTIYNSQYPFPLFDYNTQYAVGDKVFWNNNTYTCLIATQPLGQDSALQYRTYQNLPLLNVAPDNINSGVQNWGVGTPYSVPANTQITNTSFWTQGDTRSQQLLSIVIDIALFHLHSRISPKNIPELRVMRYEAAKSWLRYVSKGDLTAINLPVIQPLQGARIRYGGNIKNINSY